MLFQSLDPLKSHFSTGSDSRGTRAPVSGGKNYCPPGMIPEIPEAQPRRDSEQTFKEAELGHEPKAWRA